MVINFFTRFTIKQTGLYDMASVYKERPLGYGIINAKFPDAKWHIMHVHKLLYLVHNKTDRTV
jgi:hypothetical protein